MPVSRKRKTKVENKEVKHYNVSKTKSGKILIAFLAFSMVAVIVISLIFLMINYFS